MTFLHPELQIHGCKAIGIEMHWIAFASQYLRHLS